MKRRSWIVIGSLTGVVACPSLVAIAAVLVHDLRGPVFDDKAVPVLLASGAAGMTAGAFLTSRVVRVTPRRLAIFGSISGAVLGATTMGSLFLFAEVIGDDWPQGLSAFVTGAILGAVVGGILGRGDRFRAGRGARYVSTSLRDVR